MHSGIHVLAELVCLLAELRYILVRIVFSKDMPQICYGCVCVCVCVYQAFRLTCIGGAKSIFSTTRRYLCGGAIIVYVYQLNCTWIGVFSLWRS